MEACGHKEHFDPPLSLMNDFIIPKLFYVFSPRLHKMMSLVTHGENSINVQVGIHCRKEYWRCDQDEITLENRALIPDKTFEFNITIISDNRYSYSGAEVESTPSIQATFIPAKEVLSMFDAIVETREGAKRLAAFDDTYYDLIRDFRLPVAQDIRTGDTNPSDNLLNRFDGITGGGRIEYTDQELWFVRVVNNAITCI